MLFQQIRLHKFFGLFFVAILFFAWLLALRFNSINSPLMRDEGEYSYGAQLLQDGGVPYKESFMQKPPMIIYTYYLAQKISHNVWAPRVLALISLFLTGLVLADILRKEYNLKTASVFLFLFSPLVSFQKLEGFFAQPEIFLLLPFALSLWCYFKWTYTRNEFWLFMIGFFGAIAILYKPIIFLVIIFLFFYIIFCEKFKINKNWSQIFKDGMLFFSGGVLTTFVVFLPIILKGGFWYMWDSAFVYNRYYAAVMGFYFDALFSLSIFFWPFVLLIIYFFFKCKKNKWLFIGILISSFFGIMGGIMLHYYLIIMPVVSIICSIAIIDLNNFLYSSRSNFFKNLNLILFCAILSFLLVFPFKDYFFVESKNFTDYIYPEFPFSESVVIAEKIKNITKENDGIFIFGNEPEILYYAHRKSVSRFVITYPILIRTQLSEKYSKELIEGWDAKLPVVIVSDQKPNEIVLNHGLYDNYHDFVMRKIVNDYNYLGQVYFDEKSKDYQFGFVEKKYDFDVSLFLYKKK